MSYKTKDQKKTEEQICAEARNNARDGATYWSEN